MKITRASPYLSVDSFVEIDLGKLSIVTGPNGSGKTQLLQAIKKGNLKTDRAANPTNDADVLLHSWQTLVPEAEAQLTSDALQQQKVALITSMQQRVNSPVLYQSRSSTEIFTPRYFNLSSMSSLTQDDVERKLIGIGNPDIDQDEVVEFKNTLEALFSIFPVHVRTRLEQLIKEKNKPIFALSDYDLKSIPMPMWGEGKLFKPVFSNLFMAYRNELLSNYIEQIRYSEGETKTPGLSKEKFASLFGKPPWVTINEALKSLGLDIQFAIPAISSSPLEVIILNGRGDRINFSDLSSGEKVILR